MTMQSNLLTPQEQSICKQITTHDAPHSQRALALLALNEGSTQAQAAEQAGLSAGQVKYWVAKFRKQRLGIFPETLLDALDTEKEDSAEGKTKDTKAKKGKKAKKKIKKAEKEAKKVKKDKKSKKTKKAEKKDRKAKKAKKNKKAKKTK